MSTIEIANFIGWCLLLNFGLIVFATIALVFAGGWASSIHGKMFALEPSDLRRSYFNYLASYKLLILVFNLVPYAALRILLA